MKHYGYTNAYNIEKTEIRPLVINTERMTKELLIEDINTSQEIVQKVNDLQNTEEISTGEAISIVTNTDEDNIDLLARLINSEVGNLNDEAQKIAASVVINRVNHNMFPNSIYGVIYQYGQYAVVGNGKINEPPSEQAYVNAKFVYENGSQCPSNVIYQAEFKQGSGVYREINGEYFCYE